MKSRLLFFLPLLVFGPAVHSQQPSDPIAIAEEHYHEAAQAYLDGDNDRAERTAERGLTANPSNEKIKKLLDLIRQQQDPSAGAGNDDEQDESEEPSSDNQRQDDSSDRREDNQEQENIDSGQNAEESPRGEQGRPGGNIDTPSSEAKPASGPMTRAEAARLLDAVGAEERLLLERIHRAPTRNPEKDW